MEDPREPRLIGTIAHVSSGRSELAATITRFIGGAVVVTPLSHDEVYLHGPMTSEEPVAWPAAEQFINGKRVASALEIGGEPRGPLVIGIDPSGPDGDVSTAVVMSHDPDGVLSFDELPFLPIDEAKRVIFGGRQQGKTAAMVAPKVGQRFRSRDGRRMIVEKVNDDETVQARCLDNRKQRRARAAKRRKG